MVCSVFKLPKRPKLEKSIRFKKRFKYPNPNTNILKIETEQANLGNILQNTF